ncbi:MAG: DUF86 domain-containing protein [Nitrospirae bacterium]|nr:DUF86 domain-containing protein [Nitrospirota bacterium]
MIDKNLIEKKLRRIEDFLRELDAVQVASFDEFKADVIRKRFIERNIELSIEQMVDTCKHIVSALNLREPETYSECFEILKEGNVITEEVAGTYQSMVRFRNILIHAYEGVDDSITYGIYKTRLEDFRKFISSIREFLKEK